jgi:hypothetical protein
VKLWISFGNHFSEPVRADSDSIWLSSSFQVLEPTPIREKPNPINSSKSNNHPSSFSTRQSPSHNQNPSSSSKPGHNTRSSSNSYDEEENPFNFIPAAPSSSASSAPRTSLDRTNNSNPYSLPPRSGSSDGEARQQCWLDDFNKRFQRRTSATPSFASTTTATLERLFLLPTTDIQTSRLIFSPPYAL